MKHSADDHQTQVVKADAKADGHHLLSSRKAACNNDWKQGQADKHNRQSGFGCKRGGGCRGDTGYHDHSKHADPVETIEKEYRYGQATPENSDQANTQKVKPFPQNRIGTMESTIAEYDSIPDQNQTNNHDEHCACKNRIIVVERGESQKKDSDDKRGNSSHSGPGNHILN